MLLTDDNFTSYYECKAERVGLTAWLLCMNVLNVVCLSDLLGVRIWLVFKY